MSFDSALAFVLEWEGGYVNDPDDPGGETKYGISKRAYPDLDIASLTKEAAASIYRQDYWKACRCDDLPPPLAFMLFDAAVNQGVKGAIKALQRALRVDPDGILGPTTMTALHGRDRLWLLREFGVARALRYFGTGNFEKYGKGWMSRLFAAYEAALKETM